MNEHPMPRGNGYPIWRDLNPTLVCLEGLRPLGRETRKHPPGQIQKLATSLERFGQASPILIDANERVVSGWGLVLAATRLGLTELLAVRIADLGEAKLRALRLALNRTGEDAVWDDAELSLELTEILEIDSEFELELSGFEMAEIDALLDSGEDLEDELPILAEAAAGVTKPGDLWIAGEHRILCDDALKAESHQRLMDSERAQMVFTDPPWNIPIEDNVSGLGSIRHGDFAMACGEMTPGQFQAFLATAFGHVASHSQDGAIAFICMHWSKIGALLSSAASIYGDPKNLCVWNKANAGMGTLYRSKHELIFLFKTGGAPHVNNIQLGRFGRHRTNVWDYPGQNCLNGSAKSKLALHPTVKPVALVADAIKDCSNRGGLILDPFGGAGTTLIAAEKMGRRGRLIERDPRYVDATIARWQHVTGRRAVNAETGETFPGRADPASLPASENSR
jgi:DNA modification methylase